jgi:hypothetical protein
VEAIILRPAVKDYRPPNGPARECAPGLRKAARRGKFLGSEKQDLISLRPTHRKMLVALTDIPGSLHELYEIHEWRHASAVLMKDFPVEWGEIAQVLSGFRLLKSRVAIPGGSKSLIAASIDGPLNKLGWSEREFATAIRVDDQTLESPTHQVDCYKGKVGLEIEWNNKDPFFDRDLNNFRLLFETPDSERGRYCHPVR